MKRFIFIAGFFIYSCAEIETTNNTLIQTKRQSPIACNDYVLHESGLLVASCPDLESKAILEKQKEMQLPPICMNFVVDEKFALSESPFESPEYKECKTIVLEKLGDETEE